MSKDIAFMAENDATFNFVKPYNPAKNYIPDWYKKSSFWVDNKKFTEDKYGYANLSMKACVPFLDTLTMGYILELWCDIRVFKDDDGEKKVHWFTPWAEPIRKRDKHVAEYLPTPAGCSSEHFVWAVPYGIKTPNGYSTLLTHPINRFDLPFTTLTGIIDTDKGGMFGGNVPVFFHEDFEGVIAAGTPIMQIIPFKRDNWKSSVENDEMNYKKIKYNIGKYLYGAYKKTIWSKKTFE